VQAVHEATSTLGRFGALPDDLAETFAADRTTIAGKLTELVRQRFSSAACAPS
jgi:hypothetical protein